MSATQPKNTLADLIHEQRQTNLLLAELIRKIGKADKSPNDLILAKEAAQILGWKVGRSNHYGVKLRNLYHEGKIRKAIPGKPWLFHRGEILQLRQRMTEQKIMGL